MIDRAHVPPVVTTTGAVIARSDESLEEAFLVARGSVEAVVASAGDSDTVLRSFEAGRLIGDRALLEHAPWPATYRAGERSTLLRLSRDGLARAIQGSSDPRATLDALRFERNDQEVASGVARMRGNS